MARRSTKTTAEAEEAVKAEAAESKAAKAEETAAPKKPGRKPAAKADPIAEAPTKASAKKKSSQEFVLQIQYSGKSYAQEELKKIAGDVWKYDLKQKEGDLTSIELYVKPEENKVYYVMNKEFTGSFDI